MKYRLYIAVHYTAGFLVSLKKWNVYPTYLKKMHIYIASKPDANYFCPIKLRLNKSKTLFCLRKTSICAILSNPPPPTYQQVAASPVRVKQNSSGLHLPNQKIYHVWWLAIHSFKTPLWQAKWGLPVTCLVLSHDRHLNCQAEAKIGQYLFSFTKMKGITANNTTNVWQTIVWRHVQFHYVVIWIVLSISCTFTIPVGPTCPFHAFAGFMVLWFH